MDLLDFDAQPLWFDGPLPAGVEALIAEAGRAYGEPRAQALLDEAAARAPGHPVVQVARYRYHFYRHERGAAAAVAGELLADTGRRLGLPDDPLALDAAGVARAAAQSMTLTRFYLSTAKALAYLAMRRDELGGAVRLLETLVAVDPADRLGARALLDIARAREAELAAQSA